jgi:hypothetical protein
MLPKYLPQMISTGIEQTNKAALQYSFMPTRESPLPSEPVRDVSTALNMTETGMLRL